MKITVIGGTGMIGSRVAREAAGRHHEVTATSRSRGSVEGASSVLALDTNDTSAVVEAINRSDATVLTNRQLTLIGKLSKRSRMGSSGQCFRRRR